MSILRNGLVEFKGQEPPSWLADWQYYQAVPYPIGHRHSPYSRDFKGDTCDDLQRSVMLLAAQNCREIVVKDGLATKQTFSAYGRGVIALLPFLVITEIVSTVEQGR